ESALAVGEKGRCERSVSDSAHSFPVTGTPPSRYDNVPVCLAESYAPATRKVPRPQSPFSFLSERLQVTRRRLRGGLRCSRLGCPLESVRERLDLFELLVEGRRPANAIPFVADRPNQGRQLTALWPQARRERRSQVSQRTFERCVLTGELSCFPGNLRT